MKFCPVHPSSDSMLKCQEEMLTQIQIKFPENSWPRGNPFIPLSSMEELITDHWQIKAFMWVHVHK